MRRLLIPLALVALLAVPATSVADPPPRDWAAGSGDVLLDSTGLHGPGASVAFGAQAVRKTAPNGTQYIAVSGIVWYENTTLDGLSWKWSGGVSCLKVAGSVAAIGGSVRPGDDDGEGDGEVNPGPYFALLAEDADGATGAAGDLIRLRYLSGPPDCLTDFDAVAPEAIARGEVIVSDSPEV